MFKITQTDSLHDRMFELIIHTKAKLKRDMHEFFPQVL